MVLGHPVLYRAGVGNWRILALLWAAVPAVQCAGFARVPILSLVETEGGMSIGNWQEAMCSGCLHSYCLRRARQAMSQWASAFASQDLGFQNNGGFGRAVYVFPAHGVIQEGRFLNARYSEKISSCVHDNQRLLCVFQLSDGCLWPLTSAGLLGCRPVLGFRGDPPWPGAFPLHLPRAVPGRHCHVRTSWPLYG